MFDEVWQLVCQWPSIRFTVSTPLRARIQYVLPTNSFFLSMCTAALSTPFANTNQLLINLEMISCRATLWRQISHKPVLQIHLTSVFRSYARARTSYFDVILI